MISMLSRDRSRFLSTLSILSGIVFTTVVVQAAEPSIRVISDAQEKPVAFEVMGISSEQILSPTATDLNSGAGLRLFSVHIAEVGKPTTLPPMLGDYRWEGTALRFTPRYAIRSGLNYRAEFRSEAKLVLADTPAQAEKYRQQEYRGKVVRLELDIPKPANLTPTEITQIYPSASVLPENQLKFYIHFSAPMSRGNAYQHLELLKSDGTPVDLPFLELGEELWDTTGKRLTLLIDPGRIKKGVKPREDLGPVLEDGNEYTLVVHSDWNDAAGNPLTKSARKTFRAGPAVALAIETSEWKIITPKAGSKSAVEIHFPRSLDHALLERTVTVMSPQKSRIRGEIKISNAERHWEFLPDQPWTTGTYQLVVDTVLEDLAGNRIGRAFEVDQVGPVVKQVEVETVAIPFEIVP